MIRTIAWVITGMTLMWALAHWHIPAAMILTDQPSTPEDWAPRYRTWVNGIEQ